MADIKTDLEPIFNLPSFYDMFIMLNTKYDELNFSDSMSDSERISEYKWITQQLRKYISRQKDVILSHDNQEEMLAEIEAIIGKASEYGESRREIAYSFMRDEFLINAYRIIELYVPDTDDELEEE